ncbi:TauD/TfdA dioxygenase family protein [Arthrobacter sp. 2RAF6]|uniref:TauD/TfdA dioxygenase family protein n=1 Tax=Arthrobacter sp. 2RAF6 TaxID=3233002 RepID=UPI003F937FD3
MSVITETKLEFAKLGSRIGAEIRGFDLSGDLSPETVEQVRAALNEHKALVFREANILSDEAQVKFASHFGPLTTAHPTVASVEGEENVLPVDSENGSANNWHTDVTFVVNPPQASTLRSIDLPSYGGETLIASSAGAYADLPDELRNFADTLWAIHTNDYDYSVPKNLEHGNADERRKEFTRIKFETAHPVVRVHPLTGERGLFIGGFAQRLRIVGLSNTESKDIIRLLQAYVTRPENVVRVNWEPNQLVLFDNRITQHYAPDNYDGQPRKLNRVTIAGDIPVGVDGKQSQSIQGDSSTYSPTVPSPRKLGQGTLPSGAHVVAPL